jgi:sucrose phosphorylase
MANDKLFDIIANLYGDEKADKIHKDLAVLIGEYKSQIDSKGAGISYSEKDAILITYGDMVRSKLDSPLKAMAGFLSERMPNLVNTIHILPFFPFSSDDGFSIIDNRKVNPDFGSWEDLHAFKNKFSLMFDAVLNHISASSSWFQGFLNGDEKYKNYFIIIEEDEALPVKTPVDTLNGKKLVWTTFSADQVDLNYQNPDLLLEMIDILLFYVSKGADYIRMDAVAYIWKERGTSCIHLPQVHQIVQLFRLVLDEAAPWVKIITETNVPHKDNISYFGNRENEAQLVYNFTLPPLVVYSFHTGSAKKLTEWAASLDYPSQKTTFFNFLASHDGIGVMPVRGILSGREVEAMASRVKRLGGSVSYKDNTDGTKSPYEMNINFLDALCNPDDPNEPEGLIAKRFLASQAIMLVLKGIPGIYFHSLFGSRGWPEGVRQTGRARTINRQKLEAESLNAELDRQNHLRNLVFSGFRKMLSVRGTNPAFHPNGGQKVIDLHGGAFFVLRTSPDNNDVVICLHNICSEPLEFDLSLSEIGINNCNKLKDLLSGSRFTAVEDSFLIQLKPYDVYWLTAVE